MSDITTHSLLTTPTVRVRDVWCQGICRHQSAEECAFALHLAFPYRGVFVRHLGHDEAVADANQVLFFNPHEGYRVSHPVPGGDLSLDLVVKESLLRELAPRALLRDGSALGFRLQRLRIGARAQALVAMLRHSLQHGIADTLEAESLALELVQQSLGPRTTHTPGANGGRLRLVNRVKLLLTSDLSRRWTLAEIGAGVGHSPVYLTQVFQQVEGMPLYRYQLRLRLARALDLLPQADDLTSLSLDLGFSSHSHFTTAFRQTYGQAPSAFRQALLRPQVQSTR